MKTVIEMAREAGFKEHNYMIYATTTNDDCAKELERFAELVRADEREACAKAIEETQQWRGGGWVSTLSPQTKEAIAAAIRAKGQA